jgi:hypothetical protein
MYFLSFSYRSGDLGIQSYSEPSAPTPVNHSNLFNSMIHPFTRSVIYSIIWYQGKLDRILILL